MKIRISEGSGKKLKFINFGTKEPFAADMALSRRTLTPLEPSSMAEVVSLLRKFLKRDIPVMLLGSSGFAKSALIRQAATNIPNFPVADIIDIRAGMLNVEDLRGLPMLRKNSEDLDKAFTQSTIPSWLKKVILNPDKNYVLFFDELNHASAAVLNSVYGIILERTLEDFEFGKRTRIVAAGNKADQNEDLTELSDPLVRRMEIIDIDKAVDIEISSENNFFEKHLRSKYSSIPKEILDLVFQQGVETGDSRSIERVLQAWTEDIAEGDEYLTQSKAIPRDLYARIQKIYASKYIKTTGSERHKEIIDKITNFTKKLRTERPEFFISNSKSYLASDLVQGITDNGVEHESDELVLSPEGRAFIIETFKDEPEEFVVAALSKTQ